MRRSQELAWPTPCACDELYGAQTRLEGYKRTGRTSQLQDWASRRQTGRCRQRQASQFESVATIMRRQRHDSMFGELKLHALAWACRLDSLRLLIGVLPNGLCRALAMLLNRCRWIQVARQVDESHMPPSDANVFRLVPLSSQWLVAGPVELEIELVISREQRAPHDGVLPQLHHHLLALQRLHKAGQGLPSLASSCHSGAQRRAQLATELLAAWFPLTSGCVSAKHGVPHVDAEHQPDEDDVDDRHHASTKCVARALGAVSYARGIRWQRSTDSVQLAGPLLLAGQFDCCFRVGCCLPAAQGKAAAARDRIFSGA